MASAPSSSAPKGTFRDLLGYMRGHSRQLAVVLVLSAIGALVSLGQPLLVQQIVTRVQAGQDFAIFAWGVLAVLVVGAAIGAVQHFLLQRTGTAMVLTARRSLVRSMLRLPIAEYDQRRTGDLVARVSGDTSMLYAVMTQGLVDAAGSAIMFVGALVGMAILDPLLLLAIVVILGAVVASVGLLARRVRAASREQQDRVGALSAAVERVLGAIRTVRAANATDRETDAVLDEADGAYRAGVKVAQASALIVPMSAIAMQVSLLVVLGLGGLQVASGMTSIANLIPFIMLLFMMLVPLGQLFGAITSVNQALGAIGRIQEIASIPGETDNDGQLEPAAPVATRAAISFENVRFRYPDSAKALHPVVTDDDDVDLPDPDPSDRDVLRGVSFDVPKGTRTALVGPSGAGKSTILALVERFYDPTSGVVRFDGVDVRGIARTDLRARIGYVEQDAPALAGSLRENLLLAAPNTSDERCVEVLRQVNLGEVLDRDPRGLDAEVGEEGVMLSGGERQRLAIARALLTNAPILLLDEATASLDGLNEQLLRDAIDAAATDRTLLVIAHRLSTVVDSDRIVVLDHGEVVGVGTHSELVESTPLYRDLARHQLLV